MVDDGGGKFRDKLLRRVSWRPGAEGAPFDDAVEVAWEGGGAMRRDYRHRVVSTSGLAEVEAKD